MKREEEGYHEIEILSGSARPDRRLLPLLCGAPLLPAAPADNGRLRA